MGESIVTRECVAQNYGADFSSTAISFLAIIRNGKITRTAQLLVLGADYGQRRDYLEKEQSEWGG